MQESNTNFEEVKVYKIFNDINPIMWDTFGMEYYSTPKNEYGINTISWQTFINSKNLGLECRKEHGNPNSKFIYLITDERKWGYNKIKLEI
jgi:hypothetical protein